MLSFHLFNDRFHGHDQCLKLLDPDLKLDYLVSSRLLCIHSCSLNLLLQVFNHFLIPLFYVLNLLFLLWFQLYLELLQVDFHSFLHLQHFLAQSVDLLLHGSNRGLGVLLQTLNLKLHLLDSSVQLADFDLKFLNLLAILGYDVVPSAEINVESFNGWVSFSDELLKLFYLCLHCCLSLCRVSSELVSLNAKLFF